MPTLDDVTTTGSQRDRRAPRLPYRPGLDGLRAIAVAGVVLYHAGAPWMPGGFLGVDLFFVLSGYLITSLLLVERHERGAVDLKGFWARRARRLLPAVLLLVAFALLAASTIARDDLTRTRGDALASLLYLTNWHLIIESQSYFNAFGRPSLLQHLWSLAVEEQFYLLWPLLLLGGIALLGRVRTALLTALLAIGSVALMWSLYSPGVDPSRLYYGTDTRASTLLVGALLAFVWPAARLRGDISARATRMLDALGVAALLGMLALFWRVHDYDPGLYTGGLLGVALCGAALVAIVAHPGSRLGRALGVAPLRWVGVRSYGIYLWHWPVMELTRPRVDVPWHGPLLVIAQIAVSVALAALSYRYVEQPVRSGAAGRRLKAWLAGQSTGRRLRLGSAAATAAAVLAVLAFALPAPRSRGGAPSRTASPAALVHSPQPISSPVASRTAAHPPAAGRHRPAAGKRTGAHATLPGGAVLAAGDSVMLGCAPYLERQLGSRLRVDAVVARQTPDTIKRLARYAADGALPPTVIVQLGNNGPVWYDELVHLRRLLRATKRVVLVNVRVDRSWQDEVNQTLQSFVGQWPKATLADWYSHSGPKLLVDGVHPSYGGCKVYARVILSALRHST